MRPQASDYERLQLGAIQLGGCVPLFLTLVHDTGHRCMAVARLRWSDLDLEHGRITRRAEADKMRREHTLPISSIALEALEAERRRSVRLGDGWLFPSPRDESAPVSRHLVRDWWQDLEQASGIDRVPGRGWHSLRRKFASDHRGRPLIERMTLGGWRGSQTIVKCYQQAPEDALRDALERFD